MLEVLSSTSIETIYLLKCDWKTCTLGTSELLKLMENQKLEKVHIVDSSLNTIFLKALILTFNESKFANLFVYDPTMPDNTADDLSNLILSSNKEISGIMLIVSSSKVQGIVNTCTLSNELSTLELFNLNMFIGYLNAKMRPWKPMKCKNHKKEINVSTFIGVLHKINWQLRIALIENNVLIAQKINFESKNNFPYSTNNISTVHLSSCNITNFEHDNFKTCTALYIWNMSNYVELYGTIVQKLPALNELFVYGNFEHDGCVRFLSIVEHDISTVVVCNDVVVALHPNTQQNALAFSITTIASYMDTVHFS